MTQAFELLTADFILTNDWPEPTWAIPGLLPVGLTILAGRPKAGKSWLALQIAKAKAEGGEVLGERVQPGKVLYLALEDHPRRLRARMEKQGWRRGLDVRFMAMGEFQDKIGSLLLAKGKATVGAVALAQEIETGGYSLVVVDTLSRACMGKALDQDDMQAALGPLQALAQRCNLVILVIDHLRKLCLGDPVSDVLGPTSKTGVVDCAWGLYRQAGQHDVELKAVGRDVEQQELKVKFDATCGLWLSMGNARQVQVTERRQEVLDLLAKIGAASLTEIAKRLGQDRSNCNKRLADLVAAGLLRRSGRLGIMVYELGDSFDAAMAA